MSKAENPLVSAFLKENYNFMLFASSKVVKSANKKSIGEWRKMMKRKRAYQKRPDGKMRWPDRKICIKECYS